MSRCISVCLLSLLTLLQMLSLVEATHFRFGSISWIPTDSNSNTVEWLLYNICCILSRILVCNDYLVTSCDTTPWKTLCTILIHSLERFRQKLYTLLANALESMLHTVELSIFHIVLLHVRCNHSVQIERALFTLNQSILIRLSPLTLVTAY